MNPMDRSSRRARMGRTLPLASLALAACQLGSGAPGQPAQQSVATQTQDLWTNGLFTANAPGTTPPSGWTVTTYLNPGVSGTATAPPTTFAGLNLTATPNSGGVEETYTVGGSNGAGQYADPDLGTGQTFRYPLFGDGAARINYAGPGTGAVSVVGADKNNNVLSQTMTVSTSDIDPNDGLVHVRFGIAPVLENPSHPYAEQPYYFIQLLDLTTGQQLYNVFNYAGQVGIPWITTVGVLRNNETQWLNWGLVDISSATSPISIGDEVELQIVASGCSLGGHFGRVYVDAIGPTIPGLFVEATAEPSVAAGGTLVYTLTYTNGGTSSSVGSYVDFTTPPGTTFNATSNASCTGGTAGSASTLSCPIGTVAPGSIGSFTVTVNVTATSGTIVNGNYLCGAVNEPQLLGPALTTTVIGASTPLADVQITNTANTAAVNWSPASGSATAGPGYTIVVTNAGPTALTTTTSCTYSSTGTGACKTNGSSTDNGCENSRSYCQTKSYGSCTVTENCTTGNLPTVTDTFPSELTSVSWSCTATGSGTKCNSSHTNLSSQSGNISLSPELPSGGYVTITVTDDMIKEPSSGTIPTSFTNTASVTAGAGVIDPNLNNNTQSATTLIGTPETLTLTHTGAAYGTVLSVPAGIDCGSSCSSASSSFANGSTVTLYAEPAAGGATFSGWSGTGAANCAGGTSSTTCTFTITAATAITATFAAAPAAGSVADVYAYSGSGQLASTSTAFAAGLEAFVTDANGTPLSNQSVTFTAPSNGASGTFSNSTNTVSANTNSSGIATVPFTANATAGIYSVTVACGAVNASTGFNLTNVGPPAQLVYLSGGNNSTPSTSGGGEQVTTINSAFPSPLAVIVEDAANNPVPGATVDFSVATVSGATATLSAASAVSNGSGQASVAATANGTASGTPSYTASASVSGYAGAGTVTFYLANISGTAAAVYVVSGSGQSTPVTAGFGLPLVAVVADGAGNPVSGASVTFTAATGANGQTATITGSPVTTNALGEASVTAQANGTAGAYTVTASVTGASSATFTLTNDGDQNISVSAGSPQSTTVGTAFGTALQALVVDSTDTPVSGVDVTFTVVPSAGGATASICASSGVCGTTEDVTTNSSGIATLYSETAGTVAGSYTVQAATSEAAPVSFSLTNLPGAAHAIALQSGSGQSATVGSAFGAPLVVLITDADGNPVSGTSVTFTAVPNNGASATVTGSPATSDATGQASVTVQANTVAGGYTVTAAASGLSGSPITFNLTNNAGAPASIAIVGGSPQAVAVGGAFAPLITVVKDGDGNVVSGVSVTYTANPVSGATATLGNSGSATTGGSGQASDNATAGTVAGSYTVSASATGTNTVTFNLTNNPGAAASITYVSGSPQTAGVGSTFSAPLVALVKDSDGNPIPNATVTYAAPASGASATFPNSGNATTNGSGQASILATAATSAGGYDVTASTSGVTAKAFFSLTNSCVLASQCPSGDYCNSSVCTPLLPNGSTPPGGGCSGTFGSAACASGVCDAANDECGYANADGPCAASSSSSVCQSGVCDSDSLCGYANGDGSCASSDATRVCRSGVCGDDGQCGYPNGDGPCTPGTSVATCRSGVCDTDDLCGYANAPYPAGGGGSCTTGTMCRSGFCDTTNSLDECGYAVGDGPCTTANQALSCQSGTCDSSTSLCAVPPNCPNGDSDCTVAALLAGNYGPSLVVPYNDWCDTASGGYCTPPVVNGGPMPTDSQHTTIAGQPTVNGQCNAAAAAVVCVSGVCDSDNRCGYANGDGTCVGLANNVAVCRSGTCSTEGICMAPSTCDVDGDCSAGYWCNVPQCVPQLVNGTSLPTVTLRDTAIDGILDGSCTDANTAGSSGHTPAFDVCASQVCDTNDNGCGFANGDGNGSCANAATICRSGVCDTADQNCGYLNGDGSCNSTNASTVCRSAVCDANDGICGYANGDGPCIPAADPGANGSTVCRSGVCGTGGTCIPNGGCADDADCLSTQYCSASACVPKLPNQSVIPTVSGHNPPLTGACSGAVGASVCTSGVCDTGNNECGYVNGDGPCASGSVCQSAACDGDGNCGYANGDGPCTPGASGVAVCRSGACSQNDTCVPSGGCNVDADCAAGQWCDISVNSCTAQLPNGSPLPVDEAGAHTSLLTGQCSVSGAATLVCASGVCDTSDNKCGYLNGDGPCTSGTVCRSATCSAADLCIQAGSCDADADCSGGDWCFISTHTCTAQYPSGTPLPVDNAGAHATLLTGQCSVSGAATLVCASGVCDSLDNDCGYANGDGPCTPGTSVAVCQSGACDTDDKCGYANEDGPCASGTVCRSTACSSNGYCESLGGCNVDADCTGGEWCDISLHTCEAQLPDGTSLPTDPGHVSPTLNGACNGSAALLVCASGVCDTDNRCGYANGDGPCTALNAFSVCRSGACSTNGTCMPAGGCNVNGDCIAGDFCNLTFHSCQVIPPPGGCSSDVQCPGQWCDIAITTCEATLPNGTPIPVDPPHTSPTLNGTCSGAAAALVCSSGVCDTNDNECGYANGDGSCTQANAATVCRSGICNTQGVCGPNQASSNGSSNGPSSSSAGSSSANGGSSSQASQGSSSTNGTSNSSSSTSSSSSSSSSGGVTNRSSGSGGATSGGGASSSSSGSSTSGGCTLDSQCKAGLWCDISSATCTAQLPDGSPMPVDPGHSSPTLNGRCNAAAATLVCASGVCDTDNECGYANADGPCTQANGASVCRSGVCGPDGDCGCPNADGPCTQADAATVCRSGVCDPDGECGYRNSDGPCTGADAATVCRSAVCDPDGSCGFATGDGPCTALDAATVCRSGLCSASGVCLAPDSCDVDADCTGGFWCDISVHTCTAQLPDGAAMPTDGPHQNPVLNGTCTAAAAALVCAAGVCDTADNKCGFADGDGSCNAGDASKVCRAGVCDPNDGQCAFANGDGSCNSSNASSVCRSGVCDPDGQCGYANGDGSCNSQNASNVCRSGVCSSTGVCMGAGSCDADSDCTGGDWCDISVHTCDAKLPNGVPIPSDPGHTNPVLNGSCTAAAGALVCASAVCDTGDDRCGFANSDGPCTQASATTVCRSQVCDLDGRCGYADGDGSCNSNSASTVCRSSVCSAAGICMGSGDCETQADCPANLWCNNATNTCAGKLSNGASIPKETGPQANPVLDGLCTSGAAQLVCAADVCDVNDNRCAYANSDGPCTLADATTVCRSTVCDPDGACGYANGDGTCSAETAATVCRSGACDGRDQKCGYAINDGPCASTAQCRSGGCVNGTCIYSLNQVTPGGGLSCGSTAGTADKSAAPLLVVVALLLARRRRR